MGHYAGDIGKNGMKGMGRHQWKTCWCRLHVSGRDVIINV